VRLSTSDDASNGERGVETAVRRHGQRDRFAESGSIADIRDGETVGVSTWISYTANEGKWLTLAVLDTEHAEPGTEVTFHWGEEDGGTTKPTVERHVQTEMRAIVSPVPYVETVRKAYAPGGWRAAHAS
jgi:syringate O-demethylase